MSNKLYKITDTEGKETIINSLNTFAKEVGIYYGQFYTALHKGTKTKKGGYKVEWATGVPPAYKITDPVGIVHEVSSYKDFAKSIGVQYYGFKNTLNNSQKTCYGGYKIERIGVPPKKEDVPTKLTPITEDKNLTKTNYLQVLDIIKDGNTHKVKFRTPQGITRTRKVDIRRVDNLSGVKCDFSGVIVGMKGLYATCGTGSDKVVFSVDQLKELGYEFKIDFDFNTKVVERKVEVFTSEALEELWSKKMDIVTKEINSVQKRLTQLKEAKEYIGQSISQTKAMNERLEVADKFLNRLL